MKRRKFWIIGALIAAIGFSGCGAAGMEEKSAGAALATATLLAAEGQFTDRDKEIGYDENSAVRIELQGNTAAADSDSVRVEDGTVTITGEGCYLLTGKFKGSVVVDAGKKDKIRLVMQGAEISCEDSAALYVRQADKVFLTTAPDSDNLLETLGAYAAMDESNIDGAVFAKDDITLNGSGSLQIRSAQGHGIVCKNDLVITGGSYEITAKKHGLQGKDSVRIAGGTIGIQAEKDGIHSGNDEDESVGYTYIAGGDITLTVGDDGIHSDTQLVIAGGNIRVTDSYEGIEGMSIEIAGGNIHVRARDDGMNAAGGNDGSGQRGRFGEDPFAANPNNKILISGGEMVIDADGDGVDSNGSLYMSGGRVIVYGPTNGGNGALDFNADATVTGGVMIAIGSSSMAENFGKDSTQGAILVNAAKMQEAGSSVELSDNAGNIVLSCKAEKRFNSVVFSCPEIKKGENYVVTMGDYTEEVEMKEIIYGSGMGGFQGGMPQMPDFPGGEMPQWDFQEGEMPQMPDFPGGEMPQMPDFQGGEMPQMPDFPEGEKPQRERPEGGRQGGKQKKPTL